MSDMPSDPVGEKTSVGEKKSEGETTSEGTKAASLDEKSDLSLGGKSDTSLEGTSDVTPEVVEQDTPPDRLCANERSRYYNADALQRGVGVRFKGVEKDNVEEYCVSEGWVRVTVGKARDRKGNPMTLKLNGEVDVYFRSGVGEGSARAL